METDRGSRRFADMFQTGPVGSIRPGMPRLVRVSPWLAWLRGSLALVVVGAGLGAIWYFGGPGHHVQRALLSWLLVDYLCAGFRLRVEPEVGEPLHLIVDHPLAYYDDANRDLAFIFLWLTPGRWLSHAIVGLVLNHELPTADQLAEQLYAEAGKGVTDYAQQVPVESSQHPVDEGAAFHQALRRDHGAGAGFALSLCAAGLASALAWMADVADLWALVAALFAEAIAYGIALLAESPATAHADLLHVWLSRRRPDIAREAQQVAANAPNGARVVIRGALAGLLVMWIHVFGS